MLKWSQVLMPVITVTLVTLGSAVCANAGTGPVAPEIDITSGVAAAALLAGAVVMIRGHRKK